MGDHAERAKRLLAAVAESGGDPEAVVGRLNSLTIETPRRTRT